MPNRLNPRDIVIHRTLGRARVLAVTETEARIRVFGTARRHRRIPRRVQLRDCEKEPRPLRIVP